MKTKTLLSALVVLLAASSVSAQSFPQVVTVKGAPLKATYFWIAEDGIVTVALASGARVSAPSTDVMLEAWATKPLTPAEALALKPLASSSRVGPSPSGPRELSPTAIRDKCAQEWPVDFQMRVYCERQQRAALSALQARPMLTGDHLTIRTTCTAEWPSDFQMRAYCEEQQLKALAELQRR